MFFRYFTALILSLFVFAPASSDYRGVRGASSVTYSIPRLGITLDIPEEYDVFSSDLSVCEADNAFRVSDKELTEYYRRNEIYLEALSPDRKTDITVSEAHIYKRGTPDFKDMNGSELSEAADIVYTYFSGSDYAKDNGITVSPARIRRFSDSSVFVVVKYFSKNVCGVKYFTVNGGMTVVLSVYGSVRDSSFGDLLLADNIAESFVFQPPVSYFEEWTARYAFPAFFVSGVVFAVLGFVFIYIYNLKKYKTPENK